LIVALFEDDYFENFLPLTHTRAVFELRGGMFAPVQRAQKMFLESRMFLFSRSYLLPTLKRRVPCPTNDIDIIDDEVLFINGALHLNKQTHQLINKKLGKNTSVIQNDRLALARLSETVAKKHGNLFLNPLTNEKSKKLLKECSLLESAQLPFMSYPWDLVDSGSELIKEDFAFVAKEECKGVIDERAVIYGDKTKVCVGEGGVVEACAILDARKGPIYIGENTVVHSGSRISGPVYIGNSTIVASALIREGCSIGDVCRIGGELEQTVVQSFSNKYHLGYIGHSYIGEWVNIGAATTNSNLKNTYGTVKIVLKEKRVDTGRTKVGCFIGDHAKTSIGTQIYTGRKIGVASHAHGFITEDVPSFTVWAKSLGAKPVELNLKSAIETQKRVFARRGAKQTKEDIELLKKLFTYTLQERRKAGVIKKKFEL